jgi:hypothetical protein
MNLQSASVSYKRLLSSYCSFLPTAPQKSHRPQCSWLEAATTTTAKSDHLDGGRYPASIHCDRSQRRITAFVLVWLDNCFVTLFGECNCCAGPVNVIARDFLENDVNSPVWDTLGRRCNSRRATFGAGAGISSGIAETSHSSPMCGINRCDGENV